MEQKLYPPARIAEFAGVSRQYINRYCKEHCPEARSGRKIDISHPVMRSFLESKGVDLSKELRSAEVRTHHRAEKPVSQSESRLSAGGQAINSRQARNTDDVGVIPSAADIDVSQHGNLTLNEITARFGDHEQYRGWLDAKKKIVEIIEREIKVQKQLGELIERELVQKFIIAAIDGFNSWLLTDFCKSTPIDMRAAVESGKDNIEMEKILRILLSNQLEPFIKKLSETIGD